jgi:cell division protease FtsH
MSNSKIIKFVVGLIFTIFLLNNLIPSEDKIVESPYNIFINNISQGLVKEVLMEGQNITYEVDGVDKLTVIPPSGDSKLIDTLLENKVNIITPQSEKPSVLLALLFQLLPILIIIGFLYYFMKGSGGGGGGGILSFGKSKAKLQNPEDNKTTFADVAGNRESIEEVKEIVSFLQEPQKYWDLGGNIPRGCLLLGPPGTGKTLLAKAVAGEAGVPFYSISGSDFVEMFVGVGASRVRGMFEEARKNAPCIIFVDEIDAIGRKRGGGMGGSNDERESTLNQMLVEMDGFKEREAVIMIGATNRADVLDPALLRPGRFDRQVHIGLPDILGREEILKIHIRTKKVDDSVKANIIARGTPGFSGADLANLCNEAALYAARDEADFIKMKHFDDAKDKILMGEAKKGSVMKESEKINTAYHESGHAIIGWELQQKGEHDPVYKVSIIPRGRALGVTMYLPEEDKYSLNKREIEAQICSLYGGRIAEELTLGKEGVTTGASNDIERATEMAYNMVTRWGLTDELGPQLYGRKENGTGFSGYESRPMALETTLKIDESVKRITNQCYKDAEEILKRNKDKLVVMKDSLMKYETISASQIQEIMEGKIPTPPDHWEDHHFDDEVIMDQYKI